MNLVSVISKITLLTIIVSFLTAILWTYFLITNSQNFFFPITVIGFATGLTAASLTIFRKVWAPWTVPIYSVGEGLFLGGIIALIQAQTLQALPLALLSLPPITLLAFLTFCYLPEKYKVTFDKTVGIITSAIVFYYILNTFGNFLGYTLPLVNGYDIYAILFNMFTLSIATLNLVDDFQVTQASIENKAPEFIAWYCSFIVMITLLWCLLELLRLFSKIFHQ